jgi:hypothetical protein
LTRFGFARKFGPKRFHQINPSWGPLVFYVILFEFAPEVLPERTVMVPIRWISVSAGS